MSDQITEMKLAFADSMAQGWVGNSSRRSLVVLPNFKIVSPPSAEGCRWTLVDQYYAHPEGGYFFGHTLLYDTNRRGDKIVVWRMDYEGSYDSAALPCLKAALREAYETRCWYGGRGPLEFGHDGLVYTNCPDPSNFECFRGQEFIIDCDSHHPLGQAKYHGRLIA